MVKLVIGKFPTAPTMMAMLEMELGAEWAWLWRWVWPRCTTSCWEMITVSLGTTSWVQLLLRETLSRADD